MKRVKKKIHNVNNANEKRRGRGGVGGTKPQVKNDHYYQKKDIRKWPRKQNQGHHKKKKGSAGRNNERKSGREEGSKNP